MFVDTVYSSDSNSSHAGTVLAGRRKQVLLVTAAFLCVVALISFRATGRLNVPNHPDAVHWVLQDFRDSVYFPVVALLDGNNPYDADVYLNRYPVWRPLPLYAPHLLLFHVPFGLLPFQLSEWLYYVSTILLTALLGFVSLRYSGLPTRATSVWLLAGVILLSRPGQMNLLLGQVTLQVALGAYAALRYARTRQWLAALGLAVALLKPSFGGPLAVLMLSRGDTRVVVYGLLAAAVASLAVVGDLVQAAGGIGNFASAVAGSHEGFGAQAFNQSASGPFRIDTAALVARVGDIELSSLHELGLGLCILSIGAAVVRRLANQDRAAEPLSIAVICVTILMCTYHQAYDLLLLTWPIVALAAYESTQPAAWAPYVRTLVALLALPAMNFVASATAIELFDIEGRWWTLVTSLNPAALLVAWLLTISLALKAPATQSAAASEPRREPFVLGAWAGSLTVTMFVVVVAVLTYRAATLLNVPGSTDSRLWVLQDFRDAIYYPVVAFLHGDNPYNTVDFHRLYPVGQVFPPYSPLTMIIHLPFGLLPYRAAELAYFLMTIGLTVVVARLVLAMCDLKATATTVLGLAAVLLLSRPGHWNLLLGQCTLQLIIATYLALHYATDRPWLAAAGLAVTTAKPTFGIALTVLMLAQRHTRPVVIGLIGAALLSFAATAVLVHAAGGVVPFFSSLRYDYAGFSTAWFVNPAESPIRIDAIAFIGRLLGRAPGLVGEAIISLTILAIGAFTMRRLTSAPLDRNARRFATSLGCLVVLTYTYQQSYNTLLLALPLTALATNRWAPARLQTPQLRAILLVLFSIPLVNYLASFSAVESLNLQGTGWIVVTSINGAALLTALLIYFWLAASDPIDPLSPPLHEYGS